jgi:hypothetical protein
MVPAMERAHDPIVAGGIAGLAIVVAVLFVAAVAWFAGRVRPAGGRPCWRSPGCSSGTAARARWRPPG